MRYQCVICRISKSNGQATYFRNEVYSGLRNQLFLTRVNTARNTVYLGYDAFARLAFAQNWPQVFGFSERHNDGPDMAVEKRFLPDGRYQWIRYVNGPQDDQPLASEVYALNATPPDASRERSHDRGAASSDTMSSREHKGAREPLRRQSEDGREVEEAHDARRCADGAESPSKAERRSDRGFVRAGWYMIAHRVAHGSNPRNKGA